MMQRFHTTCQSTPHLNHAQCQICPTAHLTATAGARPTSVRRLRGGGSRKCRGLVSFKFAACQSDDPSARLGVPEAQTSMTRIQGSESLRNVGAGLQPHSPSLAGRGRLAPALLKTLSHCGLIHGNARCITLNQDADKKVEFNLGCPSPRTWGLEACPLVGCSGPMQNVPLRAYIPTFLVTTCGPPIKWGREGDRGEVFSFVIFIVACSECSMHNFDGVVTVAWLR
jgi:hypothetical protein